MFTSLEVVLDRCPRCQLKCHNVLDFFGARKEFICVTCVDKSPF